MKIHREGYTLLYSAFFFLLAINIILSYILKDQIEIRVFIAGISVLIMILLLQFFRNPSRNLADGENLIIAPADGKIVVIEETIEKEFFKDKKLQVSIFMSPFNVHINRYPISGRIKYLRYHPGKYLVAWHPKASTLNERTSIVIERDQKSLLLRQIAGVLARRIVYYPHEGDMVKQSTELGFIKFGSRVDLFLPLDTKLHITLNEKTIGGVTVIGELTNKKGGH
ncbi:MAG: phosphatidylserine decarboxylase family protein [Bacteroidia bacterium]|nr:phosphatidylserine decarboxylase family protein [Bacteroidia bacterium]MCZ2276778.1 phosphatidylserine decarboxylase family protein [Bacteroidia bacterium]